MSHIKASFALIASLQGIRQPPDAACVESSMSSVSCPRCLRSVPSYDGYAADRSRARLIALHQRLDFAGDQSRAALVGQVRPRPLQDHQDAVAEADEEED